MDQLVGAAEYTDYITAEGYNSSNKCPKQSDGEAPVMLERWAMQSIPLLLSGSEW